MKKLRITMESSLPDRAVTVSVWIDDVKVENSISVLETWTNEYDLGSTNPHTLRIKMENDYIDNQTDLNLIINKIQLSNDDGVFSQYDYLIPMENMNPRSEDNTKLQTAIMWGTPNEFNMSIDAVNPTTWYDYYLEALENPPQE